jgi:hypothetical protein
MRTIPHDPDDAAEVAAVQTPEGEPDAELIDPNSLGLPDDPDDPSSEEVIPE